MSDYYSFLMQLEALLDTALVNGFPASETNAYVICEVLSVCQVLAINDPESSVALIEKVKSYHQNESSAVVYADWLYGSVERLFTSEGIQSASQNCDGIVKDCCKKLVFLKSLNIHLLLIDKMLIRLNNLMQAEVFLKSGNEVVLSGDINTVLLAIYLQDLRNRDEERLNLELKKVLNKPLMVIPVVKSLLRLKVIPVTKIAKLLESVFRNHPYDNWIDYGIKAMGYLQDSFSPLLSALVLRCFYNRRYFKKPFYQLVHTLSKSASSSSTIGLCKRMCKALKQKEPSYSHKCDDILRSLNRSQSQENHRVFEERVVCLR